MILMVGTLPVLALSAGPADIGDLDRLRMPPDDSAAAEAVRIWLPVERRNVCRVTIDIYDTRNRLVRRLLDGLLQPGYHNFYWDKQDDSGRYVAPGTYVYRVNDCGRHRGGTLTAGYRPDERLCLVHDEHPDRPGVVTFEILEDSLRVSIAVHSRRGRVMDTLATDSLLMRGLHEVTWQPSRRVVPGTYQLAIKAGEFVHKTTFRKAQ